MFMNKELLKIDFDILYIIYQVVNIQCYFNLKCNT